MAPAILITLKIVKGGAYLQLNRRIAARKDRRNASISALILLVFFIGELFADFESIVMFISRPTSPMPAISVRWYPKR